VKVRVNVSASEALTSVEVRVDGEGGNYGREPIVGALDKACVQARQTVVAVLKEHRAA
jgi:hypothetical protein